MRVRAVVRVVGDFLIRGSEIEFRGRGGRGYFFFGEVLEIMGFLSFCFWRWRG